MRTFNPAFEYVLENNFKDFQTNNQGYFDNFYLRFDFRFRNFFQGSELTQNLNVIIEALIFIHIFLFGDVLKNIFSGINIFPSTFRLNTGNFLENIWSRIFRPAVEDIWEYKFSRTFRPIIKDTLITFLEVVISFFFFLMFFKDLNVLRV